jgi:hypothetical protein
MQPGQLKKDEKAMVWRYAHCAGLWRRKQGRNFASLESDLRAGYEVVADGITVGEQTVGLIIVSDAKDPAFFAANFKNDNNAMSDMRALDLERLRRYVISGEGELPMPPPRLTELPETCSRSLLVPRGRQDFHIRCPAVRAKVLGSSSREHGK